LSTPSLHVALTHVPAEHTPFRQSLAALHFLASVHVPQLPPPQSTSVSVPFSTRSVQVGVAQRLVAGGQTKLVQSAARAQVCPVSQGRQVLPPQSTSVSLPFLATSEHVGS
jgi:hypothetical protein